MRHARSSTSRNSGRKWIEATLVALPPGAEAVVGLSQPQISLIKNSMSSAEFIGRIPVPGFQLGVSSSGEVYRSQERVGATPRALKEGDVVGIYIDFETSTTRVYLNGVLSVTVNNQYSGDIQAVIGAYNKASVFLNLNEAVEPFSTKPLGVDALVNWDEEPSSTEQFYWDNGITWDNSINWM